jgi:Rrf2 family protein
MELSRQADYAIRAMVDLASAPVEPRACTRAIAQRQQIPQSFLPRIVAALGRARLIQTFRGNAGGIALARDASQISLLEVIQAVEGPLCLNRCTHQPSRCPRDQTCSVHPIWRQAQNYLNQLLSHTTLADLANKSN